MEILVLRGKHGDEYFKFGTQKEMLDSTEKIYHRNREYYNSDRDQKNKAERIDSMEEGEPKRKLMYEFVFMRSWSGHEYEELETQELQ